jgi:DNA-binding FadR family transcriptional regulator
MHDRNLDEKEYQKLYEARILVEMSIVGLAAQNGDDDDYELLDGLINEMSNVGNDVNSFARLDADFHTNLAYASKNKFLAEYINTIGHMLREQVGEYLKRSKNHKKEIEITIEEHKNLLAAIKNRDVEKSKVQMDRHLENAKKFFNIE